MKQTLIIISIIFLMSCLSNQEYIQQKREIIIIDSCEYVLIPAGNQTWGSHKGNCKNCKK